MPLGSSCASSGQDKPSARALAEWGAARFLVLAHQLVPFINAVKSKAPIKLVDIAMEYGMGGTTCVTSNAS